MARSGVKGSRPALLQSAALMARSASPAKRIVRIVAGVVFLVLGVLGLFLPILQGVLFLGVGLLLLSADVRAIRRIVLGQMRRHPRRYRSLRKAHRWLHGRTGRRRPTGR